jgi:hypothetical protein
MHSGLLDHRIGNEMDATTARKILTQKEPASLYDVVEPALKDNGLRDQLVEGSFAKNETYRYNCVRVLYRAIAKQPGLFYSYWDQFEKMIDSPNGFHRSIAAQAIAHLASADTDCRLDRIFNHYLALLDDQKVMVTHYFLETIGFIYHARPDLQSKIITSLLDIDKTKHLPGRKDLLKADIIIVFDQLFDTLSPNSKKKVSAFVESQLESSSPKTRKAAKDFGKKHQ